MAEQNYDEPKTAKESISPTPPDLGPGHDTAAGKLSDPRDDTTKMDPDALRRAEQGGLYNEGDDEAGSRDSKSENSGDLKSSEGSGRKDSLYSPHGDRQSGLQKIRGSFSGITSNKWLMGGVLSGAIGIIIIIFLLLIFIGNYKVVDFAEHVSAYQFAREVNQMSEDTEQITAEKISIDSADDGIYNSLKDTYANASGQVSDLWSKLDKYQPNKVINNFDDSGTMQFNYARGSLGRQVLKGVTINGQDIAIESNPIKDRLIPGYKFVTKDVPLARDFAPDLIDALRANDIGPITRARIASQIRQELDVSLVAWVIGKYTAGEDEPNGGLTVAEQADAGQLPDPMADAQVEQDTYNVAKGTQDASVPNMPANINQAAEAGDAATKNELSSTQGALTLAEQADAGQLPDATENAINGVLTAGAFSSVESALNSFLGVISPIYTVATPLCLIYDGSLSGPGSGTDIDNQDQQLERTGLWVQSAAAQEKDGSNVNGEAVGATDWKLGDITKSNAEERSSGISVNTSSYAPTEASPTGQYSIADVGLGSTLGGFVDGMAQSGVCSALTNLWVAAGVGAISVAALIPDLVAAPVEAGGESAANLSIKELASNLAEKAIAGKSFVAQFAKDTVKTGVAIGGATLIAKLIVMDQMGATHNSLATGPSYDNDADSGTNIYANQVEQREFYGAPMTDQALGPDNTNNQNYLASQESQQNAFQRYASLSNPDSLLSRVALMAGSYLNTSAFSSLPHLADALLNPVHFFGSVFGPLINHTSFAAAAITSANTYYGNIQFGYTTAEQNLMNNDPSYGLLENQQILDNSGEEATIAAKYGQCFDGSESLGTMLANGDIQRDSNGDVIANQGLCSPDNLSYNDNEFGPAMVFRWRVANNYNNALDQLGQEQDVTASDSTGSPTSASADGFTNPFPDGWTPGRLDMGYDGHFTKQIVSPCSGTIVYDDADTDQGANGGWEGAFFTVKCDQTIPNLPSNDFYFAEGVSPTVRQGQTVTAGQQIAVPGWTGYSEGPGGIEWGLADPNDPGNTLALRSQAGCTDNGTYRSMVLNFDQWIVQNLHVAGYDKGDPANQPGCA